MNDIVTLLKNRISDSCKNPSDQGVGFINCEDSSGIQYCIDGRCFHIGVREIGKYAEEE